MVPVSATSRTLAKQTGMSEPWCGELLDLCRQSVMAARGWIAQLQDPAALDAELGRRLARAGIDLFYTQQILDIRRARHDVLLDVLSHLSAQEAAQMIWAEPVAVQIKPSNRAWFATARRAIARADQEFG